MTTLSDFKETVRQQAALSAVGTVWSGSMLPPFKNGIGVGMRQQVSQLRFCRHHGPEARNHPC